MTLKDYKELMQVATKLQELEGIYIAATCNEEISGQELQELYHERDRQRRRIISEG